MGFRFRKSFGSKGLRVNVNKGSVSVSAGGRGARYTVNSSGRRTATVGIPGSGLSYRASGGGRSRASRGGAAPAPTRVKATSAPGMFAPKSEKALYMAARKAVDGQGPKSWRPLIDTALAAGGNDLAAHTLAGLFGDQQDQEGSYVQAHLEAALADPHDPRQDPFLRKYVVEIGCQFTVEEVTVSLPLGRELLAVLLAASHARNGHEQRAEQVLAAAPQTPLVKTERALLAVNNGNSQTALAVTDGLKNTDDLSCLALAARATAFVDTGRYEEALVVAKEALRFPSRAAAPRRNARLARARAYLGARKVAKAREDVAKLLADNAADAEAIKLRTDIDAVGR